jgi:glycosyltransferase 2 family protein
MLRSKIWRLLGLILFAYILYKIDWSKMIIVLNRSNLRLILVAVLINIPHLWLKSSRWQFLLALQNKTIRNGQVFLMYMSALFIGVITPGRFGEFVKAIYLNQVGITSISHGFSSVLVDRLCDLYLLFLLAMMGLVYLSPWPGSNSFGWSGLIGAVIIPLVILVSGKTEQFISIFYNRVLSAKLLRFAQKGGERFGQGIKELMKWQIFGAGVLTIFAWALYFLQCLLIAEALGLPLTYIEIIPIMAITNILTFVPISISGIGTREAALAFILLPKGITLELVLAYSMGVLFTFFFAGGVMGAVAWWIRLSQLNRILIDKK